MDEGFSLDRVINLANNAVWWGYVPKDSDERWGTGYYAGKIGTIDICVLNYDPDSISSMLNLFWNKGTCIAALVDGESIALFSDPRIREVYDKAKACVEERSGIERITSEPNVLAK